MHIYLLFTLIVVILKYFLLTILKYFLCDRVLVYDVSSGRLTSSFSVGRPQSLTWDTAGHLLLITGSSLQVSKINGDLVTSVKLQHNCNGMTVIGKCVLLFETYSVAKLMWKSK